LEFVRAYTAKAPVIGRQAAARNAKFGLDTTNLVAASQMLKELAGVAQLPKTCPFPCRIAGAGHFDDQTRSAGRRAILRKAVETWTRTWLSRRRRRLGVDYDGSRSDFDSSTNYSLQEYANDVVWNIIDVATPKASRIR